ncbi:hypothetical protein Efla_007207 [Eimeria flavescens]
MREAREFGHSEAARSWKDHVENQQSKKPLTAPGGRRQSPSSATDEPQDEKQGPASDGSARPGSQQPAAASVTSPGSPDSESNASAEEEQLILEPELNSGSEPPAAGEAVELGVLWPPSKKKKRPQKSQRRETLQQERAARAKRPSHFALIDSELPAMVSGDTQRLGMLDSGAVSQVLGPSERDTASSSAQSTDLELPSELLELYLIETLSQAEETLYDDWFLDVEGGLPSNLSEEGDEPQADFRRRASKDALYEGSRLPAEVSSSPQRQQGTVTPLSSPPEHHHCATAVQQRQQQAAFSTTGGVVPTDPQVTLNPQGFKHLCSRIMEEMKHTPAIHAPLQSAVAPTSTATLDWEESETKVDEPHARPQTEATTEEAAERMPFSAIRADLQAGPSTDVKPPDQTTVWDDGESILSVEKEIPQLRDEIALSVLICSKTRSLERCKQSGRYLVHDVKFEQAAHSLLPMARLYLFAYHLAAECKVLGPAARTE